MQQVTPESLNDIPSRAAYLKAFLNFTPADARYLRAAKPFISPLLPDILTSVYTKLLSFDITAKAFLPRNTDYTDGPTAQSVVELSLSHPQIKMRKDFLKGYLVKLVGIRDVDVEDTGSAFWRYLDNVAVMHTGQPGFKHREYSPQLRVEYVHMGLLLAFTEDLIVAALMRTTDLDAGAKAATMRAFNKVLWIQNDFFARHYVVEQDSKLPLIRTQPHYGYLKAPSSIVLLVVGTLMGFVLAQKF